MGFFNNFKGRLGEKEIHFGAGSSHEVKTVVTVHLSSLCIEGRRNEKRLKWSLVRKPKLPKRKKTVIAFCRCSVTLGEITFFVDFAVNSIYVPSIIFHLLARFIFTRSALYLCLLF